MTKVLMLSDDPADDLAMLVGWEIGTDLENRGMVLRLLLTQTGEIDSDNLLCSGLYVFTKSQAIDFATALIKQAQRLRSD